MVDGSEFLISYQQLAFLSNFSGSQLIKDLAPSTIMWCQCDIWIDWFFDSFLELVSKELNHLAAILHVYAGGLNFMK